MSELSVAPGERGVLRLFTLDMRPEEARFLREPGAAEQMLGVDSLDHTQIDVFPVSDLEELGLYGYLSEGCGISADQLDRATLDRIKGWVMVLRSKAFQDRAEELQPDPRLTLVGLYTEEATNWRGAPIETQSARPYSAPPGRVFQDDKARRIGSIFLALILVLIVGGILWLIL
ncbi:hypothetical protein AVO45_11335 [Ruegeria marisrubri]|uniref:Aspartate carbamoyltransferase catalytic subunit n=1 Tax=Ruegeria marisrubri TaxID=1685379 RepID=A0A0X3TPM3_9RHOB|nr:hypothetical protein [Ruegeria marisrubri]KUJ76386.1 hypothetical protein AVO45_11335 [Ruegeria marisrubri]